MPVWSFALPPAVITRLVRVAGIVLGLFTWICNTPTLEVPGCWVEPEGELPPTDTVIVKGVRVEVMVGVNVKVSVDNKVPVGLKVMVAVAVDVNV